MKPAPPVTTSFIARSDGPVRRGLALSRTWGQQGLKERTRRDGIDRLPVVETLLGTGADHRDAECLCPRLGGRIDPLAGWRGLRGGERGGLLPRTGELTECPVLRTPIDVGTLSIEQGFVRV